MLAVGVLHTAVPDHWLPIALIARQRGWSTAQTARAAALAGVGHTVSTLIIALVLWAAGVAFATRFGAGVDIVASVALVGFGAWVAIGALLEIRRESQDHVHDVPQGARHQHTHNADHGEDLAHESHTHDAVLAGHTHAHPHATPAHRGHAHLHRHAGGLEHVHWHTHGTPDWHDIRADVATAPPTHEHEHRTTGRTSLLLVLGSSPMVEGIPAFFAASRFGIGLIAVMAVVFSLATIGTYVALCVAASRGVQRTHFGPLERYGEVISGSFIAALGIVFLLIH